LGEGEGIKALRLLKMAGNLIKPEDLQHGKEIIEETHPHLSYLHCILGSILVAGKIPGHPVAPACWEKAMPGSTR
jgi:hypothetical protein